MSSHARWLIFIVLLSIFCVWVATPPEFKGVQTEACRFAAVDMPSDLKCSENLEIDTNGDGVIEFALNITQSLGLDLVGGLRVLLQADISAENFSPEDLGETANNVSRRVNALGLTEATVQVQGRDRILVELPRCSRSGTGDCHHSADRPARVRGFWRLGQSGAWIRRH